MLGGIGGPHSHPEKYNYQKTLHYRPLQQSFGLQVLAASQASEGSPSAKSTEARGAGKRRIDQEPAATVDRHGTPP
jgi:hypothetical protein